MTSKGIFSKLLLSTAFFTFLGTMPFMQGAKPLQNFIMLFDFGVKASQKGLSLKKDPYDVTTTLAENILKGKEFPFFVIGKHLLMQYGDISDDATDMLSNVNNLTKHTLDNWDIYYFSYKNINPFLFVPKGYNYSFDSFGFNKDIKFEKINTTEKYQELRSEFLRTSKYELEALGSKESYAKARINWSKEIASFFENLMKNSKENKIIALYGHGNYKGASGIENHSNIASLLDTDFAQLLKTFANANTKILAVTSCYFGGKSIFSLEKWMNYNDRFEKFFISTKGKRKEPIIISMAATEAPVKQGAFGDNANFKTFFKQSALFLQKRIHSTQSILKYFAKNILPALIFKGGQNSTPITNFPQIRVPGRDAQFNTVSINDEVLILNNMYLSKIQLSKKEPKIAILKNKRLLIFKIPYAYLPIEIYGTIPFFISYKTDDRDIKEFYKKPIQTVISSLKKNVPLFDFINTNLLNLHLLKSVQIKINNKNILDFLLAAIDSEDFEDSPIRDSFFIKNIYLTKRFNQNNFSVGQELKNLIIYRLKSRRIFAYFEDGSEIKKIHLHNGKVVGTGTLNNEDKKEFYKIIADMKKRK